MNYARRQQYRRLSRAGTAAAGSAATGMLALAAACTGTNSLAAVLLIAAVGFGLYSRHWLVLAGRSEVGARSEDEVQRALASLQRERWRLRHALPWRGRGDIDSVAIAPTSVAFAIETKTRTRTYDDRHLARVREQAAWMSSRRRRWCRRGVVPMICLVRARGLERVEHGVVVISIDRLIPVLRRSVGELGMHGLFDQRDLSNEPVARQPQSPSGRTEFPEFRAQRDSRPRLVNRLAETSKQGCETQVEVVVVFGQHTSRVLRSGGRRSVREPADSSQATGWLA